MSTPTHWVGTWTTSPVPCEGLAFANQTLRMILRGSLGGRKLRLRVSNAYGKAKLVLGAVTVALREDGASTVPGSCRVLTFGGATAASIPAGALLVSDPVDFPLPPLADLAVSLFLPGEVAESFLITGHGNAHQTNYISTPGNFVAAPEFPVARTTDSWCFVSAVEVEAPPDTVGIVAFGDSLTDGNLSTLDANQRWPDELARILLARGGRPVAVVNHGIGGNRILHDLRGESGVRRFDRDVLAQSGATHVVVLLGINDIRNRQGKQEEMVSAAEMIAGLKQLALRARAKGVKVYGGTLLPFENETFFPGAYTVAGEAKRQEVNAWIRGGGAFDAVIDFDLALRDPDHPTQMLPIYDCGDHLHPSDRGYRRMAESIDLALFD
jgi:lysophospholipase L1-like esterase